MSFVKESLRVSPLERQRSKACPVATAAHSKVALNTAPPAPIVIPGTDLVGSPTAMVSEQPPTTRRWTDAAGGVFASLRGPSAASTTGRPNQRRRNRSRHRFLEHSCLEREMARRF